jgi:hypothetical protein
MSPILTTRSRKGGGIGYGHALASLLFALVVTIARFAGALPAKVTLVRDPSAGALQERTLTRLRAELLAAGFDVTEVERRHEDGRAATEVEPLPGAFATIAIVPRTGDAADIWVADRITGKTVMRRVQAAEGAGRDGGAVLAVRAVELLRASLLEAIDPPASARTPSSPEPVPSPPPLPREVSTFMLAGRTATEPRFALQAGVGAIHSFAGIGPALLPVLGLAYRFTPVFAVGVRAAGPAFAADLAARGGTVAVRQKLAMLELTYELPLEGASLRPLFLAGAGVYHLDVVGAAPPPYRGESGDLLAAVFTAGPGAKFRLSARVSLLADLRLLVIVPQPVVLAAQQEVGRMSRPSLFGEAAVDVTF